MMYKIAIAHPGKIGDALYTLPTIRELCRRHNTQADFYTSSLCAPVLPLFLAQDEIVNTIIPTDYEVVDFIRQGVQPWEMPVPAHEYKKIYQLGFKEAPKGALPEYIAETAGLPREVGKTIQYQVPCELHPLAAKVKKYIVMASRGIRSSDKLFYGLLREFADKVKIPIIEIGSEGEAIGCGHNLTGIDMLSMAKVISASQGFVGYMSAPLVIANGFPIKKVIVHNGKMGLIEHTVQSDLSLYALNPKVEDIIDWFKE